MNSTGLREAVVVLSFLDLTFIVQMNGLALLVMNRPLGHFRVAISLQQIRVANKEDTKTSAVKNSVVIIFF